MAHCDNVFTLRTTSLECRAGVDERYLRQYKNTTEDRRGFLKRWSKA